MADFHDVESEEPEFAARVRAAFDAYGHKVLATLRADGSPRVSGTETRFADGRLWLAGMTRSVKFADLRRDPRLALHSGSADPATFSADAKVSGRGLEADPAERAAFAAATGMDGDDYDLFRVDLDQVVLTALSEAKDALVITSWRPGAGLTETRRT